MLKLTGGSVVATGMASGGSASEGPDEFNVGFSAEGGRQAAVDAADGVVREFNFDAVTIRASEDAVSGLEQRPDVRYVEANGQMHALDTTPWGIDRVDADVAHANGETGSGADVAIIDTGIDSDHADNEHKLGTGKAFVNCGSGGLFGCGFYGNSNDCHKAWDDDHGTHCAGIAAAVEDSDGVVGVGPDITLHAVKVLDCAGSGSYSGIAAGIEWTADQGYDVGSRSLGGDSSSPVRDACQYAYDKGVLLVAAAGNDGDCTDCVSYPAAYSTVMAVSATSCDDSLASFSSTGPEIEIAAPGENIYSTIPSGYDTFSGTSMACPHVSGAGGQLMANGYSNVDARDQLKTTAEDIGPPEQRAGLRPARRRRGARIQLHRRRHRERVELLTAPPPRFFADGVDPCTVPTRTVRPRDQHR